MKIFELRGQYILPYFSNPLASCLHGSTDKDRGFGGFGTFGYGYDSIGRLTSLAQDLSGSAYDVTQSFTYTPASQMESRTITNDAYAFGGDVNVNRPYAVNGLNQYTSAGAEAFTYDPNGNLTSQPGIAFTYDTENRLVSSSGAGKNAALSNVPLGQPRLVVSVQDWR